MTERINEILKSVTHARGHTHTFTNRKAKLDRMAAKRAAPVPPHLCRKALGGSVAERHVQTMIILDYFSLQGRRDGPLKKRDVSIGPQIYTGWVGNLVLIMHPEWGWTCIRLYEVIYNINVG